MSNAIAIAVQQDAVVISMQRASTALAEAKTMQQTKKILDVAAAAEIYAKRQQLGKENISIAHAIKLDALRKLGEMLKVAPKNEGAKGLSGGGTRGSKKEPRVNDALTLAELGLDKKTSSIAQKLAELPQEAFEQVREGHETIAKAIAAVKADKDEKSGKKPADPEPTQAPERKESVFVEASELEALKAENEALRESSAEIGKNAQEAIDDNNSMAEIFESDDRLVAAMAKIKQLTELVRVLEERNLGMLNKEAAAVRAARAWQRKYDALVKECGK